jgi:hypothetical protein
VPASDMGLTMSQRKAVTRAMATRYRASSRKGKAKVLDELCGLTGRHRDHARKALRKVWAVMDVPAGKGDGAVPGRDRRPATGLW